MQLVLCALPRHAPRVVAVRRGGLRAQAAERKYQFAARHGSEAPRENLNLRIAPSQAFRQRLLNDGRGERLNRPDETDVAGENAGSQTVLARQTP